VRRWLRVRETQAEKDAEGCGAFYLINNYTRYTPAQPNGAAVHDHLRALASGKPVKLTTFTTSVRAGGKSVRFRLGSAQRVKGTLTGTTVHSYGSAKRKPHKVTLGSVHFKLKARKVKTIVLKLARPARKLLVGKRSLKVRIRITLTSPHHRRTVIHRRVTLKVAKHHRRS
jgi:hypothetical protein